MMFDYRLLARWLRATPANHVSVFEERQQLARPSVTKKRKSVNATMRCFLQSVIIHAKALPPRRFRRETAWLKRRDQ